MYKRKLDSDENFQSHGRKNFFSMWVLMSLHSVLRLQVSSLKKPIEDTHLEEFILESLVKKHQVIWVLILKVVWRVTSRALITSELLFLLREEMRSLIQWLVDNMFVSAESRPAGLHHVTSPPWQLVRSGVNSWPGGVSPWIRWWLIQFSLSFEKLN